MGCQETHGVGMQEPIAAIRHFVHWHRRACAAVLTGLCVLLTLGALTPAPPPTEDEPSPDPAAGHVVADGRAVVPIALPDEQLAALLVPGTKLVLVHASDAGFDVITDDARPALPQSAGQGSALATASSRSPMVLVDVPIEIAPTVAGLGQQGNLRVIFTRG